MNSFTIRFTRTAVGIGLLSVALLLTAGCASLGKPASASFASVVIKNHSIPEIKQATKTVFQENGFQFIGPQGDDLVFQREATRGETISYAGFVGAQEGSQVFMQVRVIINVKNPTSYWLSCKAYAVTNPNQPVFENATPLFDFQRRPYQKLMDQVLDNLQQSPATP
jgi:hypothetical protein